MFTLYVDVSGMPTLGLEPREPFVVLGLCARERDRLALEASLKELVARYEYPGDPLELHAKSFCRTISDQEKVEGFDALSWDERRSRVLEIRGGKAKNSPASLSPGARKSWRETRPYVHLSRAERSKLFEDALDTIGGASGIILFTEVWNKPDAFRNSAEREYLEPAMAQIVSRFDYLVDWVNMQRRPGASRESGRIVFDED